MCDLLCAIWRSCVAFVVKYWLKYSFTVLMFDLKTAKIITVSVGCWKFVLISWHFLCNYRWYYVIMANVPSCYLQQRVASYEPTSWEGRRGSVPSASPSSMSIASPVLLPTRTNSFHSTSCPLSSFPWYVGLVSTCTGLLPFGIILVACSSVYKQYPSLFLGYAGWV